MIEQERSSAEAKAVEIMYGDYAESIGRVRKEMGAYPDLDWEGKERFDTRQWNEFQELVERTLETGRVQMVQDARVGRFATWLNRLSPYGCLQNACLAIAGQGPEFEHRVTQANLTFVREMLEYCMDAVRTRVRDMSADYKGILIDAGARPAYTVQPIGLAESIGQAIVDLGILAAMGVLFFVVAYGAFVRMRVV
jgi:hypothetical protein